jgi:hypothetical protein
MLRGSEDVLGRTSDCTFPSDISFCNAVGSRSRTVTTVLISNISLSSQFEFEVLTAVIIKSTIF